MEDLTAFQRDLLFVVTGLEEPNGLEVKAELEKYYETDIRHGRLYPNLDTLVDEGLIEKGKHDQRTNKYLLTGHGERVLRSRLEWQDEKVPAALEKSPQPA